MKADVAFVSCVKLKVDHPAPARDLYMRSPWFRGARRYAERQAHSWFILSAAHGLLDPDYEIAPYDLSINWMKDQDRHDWSMLVIRQMADRGLFGDRAIVLAGKNYRQHLINPSSSASSRSMFRWRD